MAPEPLWTLDDLAAKAQVSRRTVERWVAAGDVEVEHLGARVVRIRPDEAKRVLRQRRYDLRDHKPRNRR